MLDFNWSIGPHIMEGFEGTRPGDPGVEILRHKAEAGEIGGTILFSYNIEGSDQLKKLTRYIASWHIPEETQPLLIAVDQEGGEVERLAENKGFHGWPPASQIGKSSPEDAKNTCTGLPAELAEYDINVNFAPVIDVASGPQSIIGARCRSFGEDNEVVASWAAEAICQHRRHGVVATVKHFPGLGACTGDTHEDLIDGTRTWSRDELIPYQMLLAGIGIDAVMSTHMIHRELGKDGEPLTFARSIMHDLLRDELGFEGVLFTDDLGMGSIVRHYDIETVVEKSLFSGHDMLVFGQNAAASSPGSSPAHLPINGLFARAMAAVEKAVEMGRLSKDDLQKSDARLWQMRKRLQGKKAA